jgi:Glyoxalase/Bleomycin resistance protein/Dioxygenase superfamily
MITGHHYQNAYICDDIEAAIAAFATRADIGDVRPFDVEQQFWTPDGMKTVANRLAFIWIGDLQYELIQPVNDETGIYRNYKDNGGLLHFHHSCVRVPEWAPFSEAIAKQDLPIVLERANEGDQLKFLYLDARGFCGHYLEYTWMADDMWPRLGGPAACALQEDTAYA